MGDTTSTAEQVSFLDPTRSVGRYRDFIEGTTGSSLEDFLNEARQQSKFYWNPAYSAEAVNAYIRAGFAISNP